MTDKALDIAVVEVSALGRRLGAKEPFAPAPTSAQKPLNQWAMEDDDAPILAYLFRNFRPQRHLEFGTWRGFGASLCASACDAHIWTINLPDGETLGGEPAYASRPADVPAMEGAQTIKHNDEIYVRTDAGPFIGHLYREAGFAPRVTQILADSSKLPIDEFESGFFDTALVDGGHEGHIVLADTLRALRWLRPGGLCIWHDFCPDPEVQAESPAAAGVTMSLLEHWPRVSDYLEDAYWLFKSHLLIGVKKRTGPTPDLAHDVRAPLGLAAAKKAAAALVRKAPYPLDEAHAGDAPFIDSGATKLLDGAFDPAGWITHGGAKFVPRGDGALVIGEPRRWAYAASLALSEKGREQPALSIRLEMDIREGTFFAGVGNEDLSELLDQTELRGPGRVSATMEVAEPSRHNTLLLRTGPDDAAPRGRLISLTALTAG